MRGTLALGAFGSLSTPAFVAAIGGRIGLIGNGLSTVDSCQLRAWNATEAYRLIDGEWRIVHSNWAFAQTATGAIAS
ncbi:hypothetical protein GCM10010304_63790 [Streptomyces roseoviolaceus]